MKLLDQLSAAAHPVGVETVFAEPYEKDGVTVIAAAAVARVAGGGGGVDELNHEGGGGGLLTAARPAGAFIVKAGRVTWRPAFDLNRLLGAITVVAIVHLLTKWRIERSRALRTVPADQPLASPGSALDTDDHPRSGAANRARQLG